MSAPLTPSFLTQPLDQSLLDLEAKTGYSIVQVYGQRKTGPPPFWVGPPPPRGCEIFVGKLPRLVYEDELFPLFQTAGVIYEFRLMMDISVGNRGFAFVTYTKESEAQQAIELLDGYEIRPRKKIGVLKSFDNSRVHIWKIPTDKSKEEIFLEMSRHTRGVKEVIVYNYATSNTQNPGYAFVEYESHYAASMARKVLIPWDVKLFNCDAKIDWAQPDTGDEPRSVVLYVQNVPPEVDEGHLLHLFSQDGEFPVYHLRKIRNFVFVLHFSIKDAEFVMSKLNEQTLSGSSFEVVWAKSVNDKNVQINLDFFLSTVPNKYVYPPPSMLPNYNYQLIKADPVKNLSHVCQGSGWGKPIYQVTYMSSNADEDEITFRAKVFIPNYPSCVKLFSPPGIFLSATAAKQCAAEYTLRQVYAFLCDKDMRLSPIPSPKHSSSAVPTGLLDFMPDQQHSLNFCSNGDISFPSPERVVQEQFLDIMASASSAVGHNHNLRTRTNMDSLLHSLNSMIL